MSGIRSFFGKLPRPSGRQAAVGGAMSVVLAGGAWYLQQNTVYGRDTTSTYYLRIGSFHPIKLVTTYYCFFFQRNDDTMLIHMTCSCSREDSGRGYYQGAAAARCRRGHEEGGRRQAAAGRRGGCREVGDRS